MSEPPLDDKELREIRSMLEQIVVFSKDEIHKIRRMAELYHHMTWIGKAITNVLVWGVTIGFGLPQLIELFRG